MAGPVPVCVPVCVRVCVRALAWLCAVVLPHPRETRYRIHGVYKSEASWTLHIFRISSSLSSQTKALGFCMMNARKVGDIIVHKNGKGLKIRQQQSVKRADSWTAPKVAATASLRTPSVRRRHVAFRFGAIFDWGILDEMLTYTKNEIFIFIIVKMFYCCWQIKELNLDNCRSTTIVGLSDEFVGLESLSLINVGLTSLKGFPKLPNLRKVSWSKLKP